jgi:hypothetical protein
LQIARTIFDEDNRIDLPLKASSVTNYFIQVINLGNSWMRIRRMPVLESIAYSEIKSFKRKKS